MRLRDDAKAALEREAAANQRSLSEEIEARVERAGREDEILGGPRTAAIMRAVAGIIQNVTSMQQPPPHWLDHRRTFDIAVKEVNRYFTAIRPPVSSETLRGLEEMIDNIKDISKLDLQLAQTISRNYYVSAVLLLEDQAVAISYRNATEAITGVDPEFEQARD